MRISDWSSDVCSSDLDQMLDRQAIQDVVAYVRSLSDPSVAEGGNADAVAAGAEVFAENCAACHGDDGHGSTELGAPNLADGFWIYGGDRQSIYRTVYRGRRGHMPAGRDARSPVRGRSPRFSSTDPVRGGKEGAAPQRGEAKGGAAP